MLHQLLHIVMGYKLFISSSSYFRHSFFIHFQVYKLLFQDINISSNKIINYFLLFHSDLLILRNEYKEQLFFLFAFNNDKINWAMNIFCRIAWCTAWRFVFRSILHVTQTKCVWTTVTNSNNGRIMHIERKSVQMKYGFNDQSCAPKLNFLWFFEYAPIGDE